MYTNKDVAISAAQDLLYEQVNNSFRDGVKECTDIDYERSKITEYDEDFYAELWETCDCHMLADKGGPAQVSVYEFIPNTDGTFKRRVIYHLPGNTEYFYADEEEDEEEAEEI